jgi:nitroimidazol reductase NimA-like FMN-containing flavoprotein (pyridoxamine 5'-phosphate oxidase superfamily)
MSSYYNKTHTGAALSREPTARTTVRRRAGRGRYERATINAILDEGLVGHVAFVSDGQPYAMPMLYARAGDHIYLHGSPLSRLLGSLAGEAPLCLTVTLLDGLVLARSAFHHSVNYRSVVVLGRGRAVREPAEKLAALRTIVEHVSPGRSADARGPSEQELEATELIGLALDEASAKVRTGPPVDAPEDYALPVWAGELPLRLTVGEPVTDPRCTEPVPESVRRERGRRG